MQFLVWSLLFHHAHTHTHTHTHTQLLFNSRLQVYTWLLVLQCISVAFQLVVLLRCTYWYQVLSMSVFLVFNYFVLYKLLHNRLWLRRTTWLTSWNIEIIFLIIGEIYMHDWVGNCPFWHYRCSSKFFISNHSKSMQGNYAYIIYYFKFHTVRQSQRVQLFNFPQALHHCHSLEQEW